MEVHNKDKSVWSNDDIKSFLVSKRENVKSNDEDSGVEEDTEHDSIAEQKIANDETVSDANVSRVDFFWVYQFVSAIIIFFFRSIWNWKLGKKR